MFCETIFMRKRIPWSRRLSKGVLIGFDDELFGGSRLFDPGTGEQGDEMTKTISKLMALLFLAWPSLTGLQLPASGPLPDKRPESAAPAAEPPSEAPADEAARPEDVPTPQDKPTPPAADPEKPEADDGNAQDAQGPDLPPKAAEPAADAKDASPPAADGATDTQKEEETAKPQPPSDPPPQPEDTKALAACLVDLKAIGATFEEKPAIDDETGCGIAAPITVTKLLPDVTLEPEATIRCETALQLARMTRDMLKPAAETAFQDKPKLTGILQASGYVCRNRNSAETGKVSEHAYGNAIDIAGLRFGDREEPVMIAKQDDGTAEAAFQRAFNAIACLYFTTVLSPGSDPTHQDHMHLDVIERKSGFRYCR